MLALLFAAAAIAAIMLGKGAHAAAVAGILFLALLNKATGTESSLDRLSRSLAQRRFPSDVSGVPPGGRELARAEMDELPASLDDLVSNITWRS